MKFDDKSVPVKVEVKLEAMVEVNQRVKVKLEESNHYNQTFKVKVEKSIHSNEKRAMFAWTEQQKRTIVM